VGLDSLFHQKGGIYKYNGHRDVPHITIEVRAMDPELSQFGGQVREDRWVCRNTLEMLKFLRALRPTPRIQKAISFLALKAKPFSGCRRVKYTEAERQRLRELWDAL